MNGQQVCRKCGKVLNENSDAEFCSQCVLKEMADWLLPDSNLSAEIQSSVVHSPETLRYPIPGQKIGAYEIQEEIGQGGMGIIYRARHVELNRNVALKALRFGSLTSESMLHRFRLEALSLARLDHPNIVPIYDVGDSEGFPYYTMKWMEGGSLLSSIQNYRQDFKKMVTMMILVCEAVHAAHQHGILHRDIKPANILLDTEGNPFVSDFGLAMDMGDEEGVTLTGNVMGTPNYMAPEQALGSRSRLSVASDIYGIGAVLYHLLSGQAPFQGVSAVEVLRKTQEQDPPAPSVFEQNIDHDLENICIKCLEKDPKQRYESAFVLAKDLRAWLAGEPVAAKPISNWTRLIKWGRRKPALAGLSVLAALLFLSGFAGVTWQWRSAEEARALATGFANETVVAKANTELALARVTQEMHRMLIEKAEGLIETGRPFLGLAHLNRVLRSDPQNQAAASKMAHLVHSKILTVPSLRYLQEQSNISCADISTSGQLVVTGDREGVIQVWDLDRGIPIGPSFKHEGPVEVVSFLTERNLILTKSKGRDVHILNYRDNTVAPQVYQHDASIQNVVVSQSGPFFATILARQFVKLWNRETGEGKKPIRHPGPVTVVGFDTDGKFFLTGGKGGLVNVWDIETESLIETVKPQLSWVNEACFSPDGLFCAGAFSRRAALLWRTGQASSTQIELEHGNRVNHVTFDPNSQFLATSSRDNSARIWDAEKGEATTEPLIHEGWVLRSWFTSDSKRLLTQTAGNIFRLWDVETGTLLFPQFKHDQELRELSISQNGEHLILIGADGGISEWRFRKKQQQSINLSHSSSEERGNEMNPGLRMVKSFIHPVDNELISVSLNGQCRIWDFDTWELKGKDRFRMLPDSFLGWVSENELLYQGINGNLFLWNKSSLNGARVALPIPKRFLNNQNIQGRQKLLRAISLNLQWQVVSVNNQLLFWDMSEMKPHKPDFEMTLPYSAKSIEFSDDNQRLFGLCEDDSVYVINVRDQKFVGSPLHHEVEVASLVLSSNSTLLAVQCVDHSIWLWDLKDSVRKPAVLRHESPVRAVVWDPLGSMLATGTSHGNAYVWNATNASLIAGPMEHSDDIMSIAFDPLSARLATGTRQGEATVFNIQTGQPITPAWKHDERIVDVRFNASGDQLITSSWDGTTKIWNIESPPLPVPPDFIGLLEAVAGNELTEENRLIPIPREERLGRLEQLKSESQIPDYYTQLGRALLNTSL